MSNHRCIVDNIGGEKHPYGYCIKPLDEMIDYGKIRRDSGPANMVGIKEGAKGIVNYATALVSDPRKAIANECGGKLGNRYVLKSKMKCKNMSENVHIYINNVADYNFLTQRKDNKIGIIPATVGSALQINGLPLLRALYEDPNQDCIKTTIPCHLIDKNDSANNYTGNVDNVPITVRQYDELVENKQINPTQEQRDFRESLNNEKNPDSFTNLHESIYNYLDENPQLLNIKKNSLPIKELDNSNQDILFNLYYLFLSIFFLFLLFKIMNKK
jgi:hypothetical protein